MTLSVSTIPPGAPFVDALAAGILARHGGDPLDLAAVTVLLPTRRACLALRDAFLRRSGGAALLLPRITPLGDVPISAAVSGAVGLTFFVVEPLMATSRITGVSSFLKEKLLRIPDVPGPANTRLAASVAPAATAVPKNFRLSTVFLPISRPRRFRLREWRLNHRI